VNFELSRFRTKNNELIDLTVYNKRMIVTLYVLIKILVKKIILDQTFSLGGIKSSGSKRYYSFQLKQTEILRS